MTDAGGGGNGVWRWLAGILAAILLTGAPGIIYGLRTWSIGSDVARIQGQLDRDENRDDDVRTRLAVLEGQYLSVINLLLELRADLAAHERQAK